jgi:hypothetical protein
LTSRWRPPSPPQPARINAAVISRLAVGGDPAYAAIRQQADDLERSACEVEARPASFWRRREAG